MVNWGTGDNSAAMGASAEADMHVETGAASAFRSDWSRRGVLIGMLATGVLMLPGCSTLAAGSGLGSGSSAGADPVRRLMRFSSERAFAWLGQPEGFWTSPVARIPMPVLFDRPGRTTTGVLKSKAFRDKLQYQLNLFATPGARVAGPLVLKTVQSVAIPNPAEVMAGGNTAATTLLRRAMGPALVNAMIPEIERAMKEAQDPTLNQAIAALKGVTVQDTAHALALDADNGIWYEIGAAEAAIRQDPADTNDAVLIGAFKKA
ncbi:uncharacterized protein DUF4197 [Novosphingobium sp. PhB57]|uniref:DUF4197 domain-containing protein n=1 Tax=Novosphingobium sp. YAF33 TaxID=3233082 RepID=UPI0010E33206|nr:uncharacterized protein DUF4197 [Novosphingobium sp. PhB57]